MAKLTLDHGGIGAMLKSREVAAAIGGLAETVAGRIDYVAHDGKPVEVLTGSYTTDRAAASVTVAHPSGLGAEAKHGLLVRAAASAGLEVRAK